MLRFLGYWARKGPGADKDRRSQMPSIQTREEPFSAGWGLETGAKFIDMMVKE